MQQIEDLLQKTVASLLQEQRFPEGTYRLQFHAGFSFQDARRIIPYLRDLGITHCYGSPYLQARPGSKHGYDITNHQLLNPEIGSPEDFEAWVKALKAHGLEQVLDMVPNHMGIIGNENVWWNDVLENGPASPYAGFFDISWYASPRPELQEKVLLPFLGEPYGKVLESQQIRLSYEAGTFALHYFEHRFPVAPLTYAFLLEQRLDELERVLGPEDINFLEYQSILTAVRNLPGRSETSPAKVAERQREKEVVKRRLSTLTEGCPPVHDFIARTVALFNGKPGDRHSFDLLDQLLDQQPYRLSNWRVASDEINYRRFFDVNELAALSMEKPEVFTATHDLVLHLLRERKISGLRIDHPDGLYDPRQYLERLQERFVLACARNVFEAQPEWQGKDWKEVEGPLREQIQKLRQAGPGSPLWRPLYVIVEKILGISEAFPRDWPTYGSSGYNFLNLVNGLFVDADNAQAFARLYQDWTGDATPFPEIVYRKKYLIMQVALSSELHMLAYQLDRLAQKDRRSRDFTLNSLRHALREVIACFPVYRSYIADEGFHDTDRKYVLQAINRAKAKNPALSASIFFFVRDMLLLKYPDAFSEEDRAEVRRFVGKFQQVTAPVMAKGVEDTAFYVYNRLASLNEVGGDPVRFGVAPAALHKYFQERQESWPHAFSALSTHDTKRSEDVRARLNVLSELPHEWQDCLIRWSQLNRPCRIAVDDEQAPDANEEYLLYQTLLGAWPLEPGGVPEHAQFVQRIQAYMIKALHEAKVHTSWINPNPAYDDAVQQFIGKILDEENRAFLEDFRAFQKRISYYGLFNSLSQVLLKIAAPGVPDTYQGQELWDFSLVDPDNRRPVDYEGRRGLLEELRQRLERAGANRLELARDLVRGREDGRIKLYVTMQALRFRREQPGLFATGEYHPVEASGPRAQQVFAFLRRQGDTWALVAVPRLLTRLAAPPGGLPLGREVWQETRLALPNLGRGRTLENLFTGEALPLHVQEGRTIVKVAEMFGSFPVGLWVGNGGA